jgi:hypothetical protein
MRVATCASLLHEGATRLSVANRLHPPYLSPEEREESRYAMPKFSSQEALKHLGGSAAQIDRGLRRYGETARALSSDHPRMIDEHPSRWIGVYRGHVVATGRSLNALLARLQQNRIPREETIIRFIDKKERTLIL